MKNEGALDADIRARLKALLGAEDSYIDRISPAAAELILAEPFEGEEYGLLGDILDDDLRQRLQALRREPPP